MENGSLLRYDNVTVRFGEKTVLEDFNLTVRGGDKVLIFGPSGKGKSTILLLAMGMVEPDAGSVYFRDAEVDSGSVWEVRRQLAYVPQNPDIGEGKVRGLIESVFDYKANRELTLDQGELRELLEQFTLEQDILEKNYQDLSGGEKQRVAIIIAVLLRRCIFLLDEPTASLDPEAKRKVMAYFLGRKDCTVVAVSHDSDWLEAEGLRSVRI